MTRQETIDEITRRLVEFYQPVRLYLFGSAARGDSRPDSALDFCVVLLDDPPEGLCRIRSIHGYLRGLRAAVEVVRLPCSDFYARGVRVVASLQGNRTTS